MMMIAWVAVLFINPQLPLSSYMSFVPRLSSLLLCRLIRISKQYFDYNYLQHSATINPPSLSTLMDPVSALGVAAAAVQFAGDALYISNSLAQFILNVKKAPKKSQELKSEILFVSRILEDLKSTLETMHSTERSLTNDAADGFI